MVSRKTLRVTILHSLLFVELISKAIYIISLMYKDNSATRQISRSSIVHGPRDDEEAGDTEVPDKVFPGLCRRRPMVAQRHRINSFQLVSRASHIGKAYIVI